MDISRREFVQSAAAVGAGMLVADRVLAQAAAAAPALNVALIGAGTQGRVLLTD